MRHVLIGAMVLALNTGAAVAEPALPDVETLIGTAHSQVRQGEYSLARDSLARALAPAAFVGLTPQMAYAVLSLNARALAGLEDWPAAHKAFVAVTTHRNAIADDWVWRAEAAYEAGDEADALFAAGQAAASAGPPQV